MMLHDILKSVCYKVNPIMIRKFQSTREKDMWVGNQLITPPFRPLTRAAWGWARMVSLHSQS